MTAMERYISLLDREEVAGAEVIQVHRVNHSQVRENMTDLARLNGQPSYLLDKPLRSSYLDCCGPEPAIRVDPTAMSLFKVHSGTGTWVTILLPLPSR